MDYLKTDDMQFGCKNNHSPVLCTAVYIDSPVEAGPSHWRRVE